MPERTLQEVESPGSPISIRLVQEEDPSVSATSSDDLRSIRSRDIEIGLHNIKNKLAAMQCSFQGLKSPALTGALHLLARSQLPGIATAIGCDHTDARTLHSHQGPSATNSGPSSPSNITLLQVRQPAHHNWHAVSVQHPASSVSRRWLGTQAQQLQVTVEPLSGAEEGISVLSLCRSEGHNAIGRRLVRELADAIDLLRQERTTRCVVIRSSVPGVFSVGLDLHERAGQTQHEALEFANSLRQTLSELQALPMPSIAAVEGMALGAGAELVLACDMRVAGGAASFAFPETRMGSIPLGGATQRLPRAVGLAAAKELILTGRRIGAEAAAEMRLVNMSVADGEAYNTALWMAREVALGAPLALRCAKAALEQGADLPLSSGLKVEECLHMQVLGTRDRAEGIKAFMEGRAPQFIGE